ncbi:MAG: FxLYD domain-containing protein [Methanomicrobiales archaeon]|nr:FxLYD domain-containing protein [Methanomicrobiales archaeon]
MGALKVILAIVLVLLMGAILLFFAIPFLALSSSPASEARSTSPSVTILSHSGAINPHSATYVVQGIAKNTGTTKVAKVYIVVTTFDSSGAELGCAYDALLDLNPGDEAAINVEAWPPYQGIKVARYNIVPNYNAVPGCVAP